MYCHDKLFTSSLQDTFGEYFPCCFVNQEINQNNSLVNAYTIHQFNLYIIL